MPATPREAVRFASRVAADPAETVGRWRALSGGKAVGCLPPVAVPEILHAGGLLPVQLDGPDIPDRMVSRIDAWVVGPGRVPRTITGNGKPRIGFPPDPDPDPASALDRMESLAEWVAGVSGHPVSEGCLWKSIAAYRERSELLLLLSAALPQGRRIPSADEAEELVRAGHFLPPETHSLLLALALGETPRKRPGSADPEPGDPLVFLSRRLVVGNRSK